MRNLFIIDWGWKLFSLFLAVTIWLTVHSILEPEAASLAGQNNKFTLEKTVLIVSSTADVSFYRTSPAVVTVTVSGPPTVMDQLKGSQIRALVDLTNSTPGMVQVSVLAPPEVTLIRIEPPVVAVIPPVKR
jgi:YbbR domain-containing protein